MRRLLLIITSLTILSVPALAQTTSPDLVAMQQMFTNAQTGEFNALREVAQLRTQAAQQADELTKLRDENEKLKAAAAAAAAKVPAPTAPTAPVK